MWKNSQRGFTIIELLVVLGIIVALAAIIAPLVISLTTDKLSESDTTPPVVSNIQPVGPLPAGTSETTFSFEMTELMPCWVRDTGSDVEYGMESWTPAGSEKTTYRTTVDWLSDGKIYTFSIRCVYMDSGLPDFTFTHVFNVMPVPPRGAP